MHVCTPYSHTYRCMGVYENYKAVNLLTAKDPRQYNVNAKA